MIKDEKDKHKYRGQIMDSGDKCLFYYKRLNSVFWNNNTRTPRSTKCSTNIISFIFIIYKNIRKLFERILLFIQRT